MTIDRPHESITETVTVIEGHLPAEAAKWDTSSLLYLPFEVPTGASRITIRREMEPLERQKVALLLYDPRGYGLGAPGFRGYQGAVNIDAELTITADPDGTTSWYLAGPLQPGVWHVGQWYVQPTEGGLRYRYTVTIALGEHAPTGPMPVPEPYEPGTLRTERGWYAGSLHSHTINSYDTHIGGKPWTLADLAARHVAEGYDFMACTDHNQTRTHFELADTARQLPGFLLIPGNELTTLHGHANEWGLELGTVFDFRINPGDGNLPRIIEETHRQGALFVVNHPFQNCPDCAWRFPADEWEGADAIEVWNREWSSTNRQAVDWWDAMLKAGRRIAAVGGSDFHRDPSLLSPSTHVYAENLSQSAVLEAIKQGRTFVSENAVGPKVHIGVGDAMSGDTVHVSDAKSVEARVHVLGGEGMTLRFVWHEGETEIAVISDDVIVACNVPVDAGRPLCYVRAELSKADRAMAALTNPIYLERASAD